MNTEAQGHLQACRLRVVAKTVETSRVGQTPTIDKRATGLRIAAAREAKDMKPVDLAKALGTDGTTIWRYEKGRTMPEVPALKALAAVLGTTIDWLVCGGAGGPVADPAPPTAVANDLATPPGHVSMPIARLMVDGRWGNTFDADELAALEKHLAGNGPSSVLDLAFRLAGFRLERDNNEEASRVLQDVARLRREAQGVKTLGATERAPGQAAKAPAVRPMKRRGTR